ncbi:hypothetical protein ABZP36_009292 [Zizania latifolia]
MALSSVLLRQSPLASPAAAASSPRRHLHASVLRVTSRKRRALASRSRTATSLSVRCEQSSKQGGGGADVWLSRLAMVSFSTAVVVEVSTGKGLVANFGVATPAPTLALAVTSLVAGLAVYFIFQSGASRN